jgi:hypothetical protein
MPAGPVGEPDLIAVPRVQSRQRSGVYAHLTVVLHRYLGCRRAGVERGQCHGSAGGRVVGEVVHQRGPGGADYHPGRDGCDRVERPARTSPGWTLVFGLVADLGEHGTEIGQWDRVGRGSGIGIGIGSGCYAAWSDDFRRESFGRG